MIEGDVKIMTPEQKEDWDKTLWRSRVELPFPLNYLWRENPALAYMIVKVGDTMTRSKETSGCGNE